MTANPTSPSMRKLDDKLAKTAEAITAGNRRALSQAITLVESTRAEHRAQAEALINALLSKTGGAVRLGISGTPGVGKSTFIEAFGLYLVGQGHKVAVLAVDPTSVRTGGSILGDKTRMQDLSRQRDAFIRPSPSGGTLGGVARRTREAMLLCEAAGFDVILIETVGVGQSETTVAEMVDMFMLLLAPGGGDELQGIKKGIVEIADLLVINKADGTLKQAATHAQADYRKAMQLLRPTSKNWTPPVLACSAIEHRGIDEVWATVMRFRDTLSKTGEWQEKRARQAKAWMWSEIRDSLLDRFLSDPAVAARIDVAEREVGEGRIPPTMAARDLLERFLSARTDKSEC